MRQILVQTRSKSYDVLIESGLLPRAGVEIRRRLPQARHFVILTSPVIQRHWIEPLRQSFAADAAAPRLDVLSLPAGERYKTMKTVARLAEQLVELQADRNTVLVALGGGVVGDVTGFVASIYMRGIRFVQIPTTFLAQVDSSVGGKTGVNLRSGKNLVGAFRQPELVLIDPETLATLPGREFRSGLFESLKAGVIRTPRIFDFMEENRAAILARQAEALEWVIAESVAMKAEVVGEDEEEHGVRRILNFGHTLGHALESETNYRRFLHGEAVAWGMIAAAQIAVALGRMSAEAAKRLEQTTLAYAKLPSASVDAEAIFARLAADKKTLDGQVHFILPRRIGEVEVATDVPKAAVIAAVQSIGGRR